MSNYPNNMRSSDCCPGSPYYVDPDEWQGAAADDLAKDWKFELKTTSCIAALDMTKRDIDFLLEHGTSSCETELLADLAMQEVQKNPDAHRIEPDYEVIAWG